MFPWASLNKAHGTHLRRGIVSAKWVKACLELIVIPLSRVKGKAKNRLANKKQRIKAHALHHSSFRSGATQIFIPKMSKSLSHLAIFEFWMLRFSIYYHHWVWTTGHRSTTKNLLSSLSPLCLSR